MAQVYRRKELSDAQELKKYRHIIALLIDASIGYFTPRAALRAIEAYQENVPFYCEWYSDTVMKRLHEDHIFDLPDSEYIKLNHDLISECVKCRHHRKSGLKECLVIVDRNIAGNESLGASWF